MGVNPRIFSGIEYLLVLLFGMILFLLGLTFVQAIQIRNYKKGFRKVIDYFGEDEIRKIK